MRIGRSEAVDLLSKWRDERALLLVNFSLLSFAACFRGRVFAASEETVKLISDDTFAELTLPLRDECAFAFGDSRDFPEEAASFDASLVVFLPGSDEEDFIAFSEVIEK